MASHQDQIAELRILIKENRFDEAREILENIDHPKAGEWLRQLEARETAYKAQNRQPIYSPAKTSASETRKPLPEPEAPQQTPAAAKFAITFVRVFIGSVVGFGVVLAAMIFLDQQFSIHNYFLDDSNRRVLTLAAGFAVFSTFAFCFIARLIGGASNFFIGIYYALLALLMLAAWQYISIYNLQGGAAELGQLFSAEATNSYGAFFNTIPLETMLAYGGSVLVSLGGAYFLGATSDEELRRRTAARKR
jgi:hypothetical protein